MGRLMEGKSGFVTGAGSGIGRGSALAFAKAGANVLVSDVNEERGKETVRIIKEAGGTAAFFLCNVAVEEEVKALVNATIKQFGRLDFAHNNAGIGSQTAPIAETDSADWDKVMKVNLYGMYFALKHEIRAMMETGGAIVNTASTAGLNGIANLSPYSASKFAVNGLTKSAALEYGKKGIRMNAICPGMTLTPAIEYWLGIVPEQANAGKESIPTGQVATPEDQGNAAVFLCSD